MNTITARFAGGDPKAIANKLMDDLDGLKVRDLSVTLRYSGNEMNPQIENIALPDRDRSEDALGILPGQDLNSPLEGPGFGSKESQASMIVTAIPEPSKEQKAATAANEKAHAESLAEVVRVTDEELEKAAALEKERDEEWKAENRRAAARGVIPVGPPANPDAPDLKVAVVPNDGAAPNDNGLDGAGGAGASTSTDGKVRRAANRTTRKSDAGK